MTQQTGNAAVTAPAVPRTATKNDKVAAVSNDPAVLARRIREQQGAIALAVRGIKHEANPKVIADRAKREARQKVNSVLRRPNGELNLPVVGAAAGAVVAIVTIVIIRRRR